MGKRKATVKAEGLSGVNTDGSIQAAWAQKLPDGQALMRGDVQYDLLSYIFGNAHFRFTPPSYAVASASLFPADRQWTFAELYLDCIVNSPKAPRTLREKMAESQTFAVNFAKVGLLCNTGRINTTMALNKDMDDFTRRYVPDAPRMKAQIKGCQLPSELMGQPDSLRAIAERAAQGLRPSTTSVNLIFLLFAQSDEITLRYMPAGFDFNKLFYSMADVRSSQRAEIFLAIVHRFLETPHCLDDLTAAAGQKINLGFQLQRQPEPIAHENQDPVEEKAWAESQRVERADFLLVLQEEEKIKHANNLQVNGITLETVPRARSRGKREQSEKPFTPPATLVSSRAASPFLSAFHPISAGHALLQPLDGAMSPLDLHWHKILETDPHRDQPLLQVAWQRLTSDLEASRDPVYDSDNEDLPPYNRPSLTSRELRPRLSPGFVVQAPQGGLAHTRYIRPRGDAVVRLPLCLGMSLKRRSQMALG